MIDYKNWDMLDSFRIGHAACLWCDVQPTNSWLLAKINSPEIIPIYEMLEQAWGNGDFKRNKIDLDHVPTNFDGVAGEIVSRDDLVRLALERGHRPAFLFPDERNKSEVGAAPENDPVASNQPGGNKQSGRKKKVETKDQVIVVAFETLVKTGKVKFTRGGLTEAKEALHQRFPDYEPDTIRKMIQPHYQAAKAQNEK